MQIWYVLMDLISDGVVKSPERLGDRGQGTDELLIEMPFTQQPGMIERRPRQTMDRGWFSRTESVVWCRAGCVKHSLYVVCYFCIALKLLHRLQCTLSSVLNLNLYNDRCDTIHCCDATAVTEQVFGDRLMQQVEAVVTASSGSSSMML